MVVPEKHGRIYDLKDENDVESIASIILGRDQKPMCLPELFDYKRYTGNIVAYKSEINHDLLFGRLQIFTDEMARSGRTEFWTLAVQWKVEKADRDLEMSDSSEEVDEEMSDEQTVDEAVEEKEQRVRENAADVSGKLDGDIIMQDVTTNVTMGTSGHTGLTPASSAFVSAAPSPTLGPLTHTGITPTMATFGMPDGPDLSPAPNVGQSGLTPTMATFGMLGDPALQPGTSAGPMSLAATTTAGPMGLAPTTTAGPSGLTPTMLTFGLDSPCGNRTTNQATNGPASVPAGSSSGPPKVIQADWSRKYEPPMFVRTINDEVFKNEEFLRHLCDIVQADEGMTPNYIEMLYRWLDRCYAPGYATYAALNNDIPSLWNFADHPADFGMYPLADNNRATTAEGLTGQYRRSDYREPPAAFNMPVDDNARDRNFVISNIPRDPMGQHKYLVAICQAKEKAMKLLSNAGIDPRLVSNYVKGQPMHPAQTPLNPSHSGWGTGLDATTQFFRMTGYDPKQQIDTPRISDIKVEEQNLVHNMRKEMEYVKRKTPGPITDPNALTLLIHIPHSVVYPHATSKMQLVGDILLFADMPKDGDGSYEIKRMVATMVPTEKYISTLCYASMLHTLEGYPRRDELYLNRAQWKNSHYRMYRAADEILGCIQDSPNREACNLKRWFTSSTRIADIGAETGSSSGRAKRISVWEGWFMVLGREIGMSAEDREDARGRRKYAGDGIWDDDEARLYRMHEIESQYYMDEEAGEFEGMDELEDQYELMSDDP